MSEQSDAGIHLLLVSDPGVTTRRANAVQEEFQQILQDVFRRPVQVSSRTDMIRIDPRNELDFSDARQIAEEYEWVDVTLMLTEIPRHSEGKPLIAEIFPEHQVGALSFPTLGGWATKRRLLTVMVNAVMRLRPAEPDRSPDEYALRWSEWSERDDNSLSLHAHTWIAGIRTVMGMTVANEPWRTAPQLSGALAAASAAGAFGIFFNSIWDMADSLSVTRLLFIGLGAMVAMGAWLILSNGLWDRPKNASYSRIMLYYNLSTALTIAMCMLALYVSLVLLILIGAVVVIDPGFMGEMLSKEAQFNNYLNIAWLSAAMGTVAGALGSGFDSDDALRKTTHGQRERQRQYSEDSSNEQTPTRDS